MPGYPVVKRERAIKRPLIFSFFLTSAKSLNASIVLLNNSAIRTNAVAIR